MGRGVGGSWRERTTEWDVRREGKLWLIHKIKGKMLINLPGLHVEFKEA